MSKIGRDAHLTQEEELALSQRWQRDGDERALDRLIHAHLGLVARIASELRGAGSSWDDLVQEGNLGLTIAARRFDPARGTRLSTYATHWIRACILEHIVRTRGPVRIGTTRTQRKIFFGMSRARQRLEAGGERADFARLATELGVDEGEVRDLATRLSARDVSLDAPRTADGRLTAGDSLASDAPSAEDAVGDIEQARRRRDRLRQGLKQLDPRERRIIHARHLREEPATLDTLGRQLSISRERVRQLEERATAKLRKFLEAA